MINSFIYIDEPPGSDPMKGYENKLTDRTKRMNSGTNLSESLLSGLQVKSSHLVYA
jgi:hypothetical protein